MKILLVDSCDFTGTLYGSGGVAVIASALRTLGTTWCLVGGTSMDHKLGEWTNIEFEGMQFEFMPVYRHIPSRVSTIPSVLKFAVGLWRYHTAIASRGIKTVFTRTYTALWYYTSFHPSWSMCFYYPGLGNPMLIGRRPILGRYLATLYEYIQGQAASRAEVLFAAASHKAIADYKDKIKALTGKCLSIIQLPTSVNTNVFYPRDKLRCREILNLPKTTKVFTFIGRLAEVKGIPFLFDAMLEIRKIYSDSLLLLVGDGEGLESLRNLVRKMALQDHVCFLGKIQPASVATAIGAADVCVISSFCEGFSNAMLEELACGRPIVTTAVSGATEVIRNGLNGYVIHDRDPNEFARKMMDAALLIETADISHCFAVNRYSEENLWSKVKTHWTALK